MTSCQKHVLERYTCELALEHAEDLLKNKVFAHAEPDRPPSDERKRESRTTLILSASEALLAKHAYAEAEAYEECLSLLGQAEHETDVIALEDFVEKAAGSLARLPRAKFTLLHARHESLVKGLEAERDDIEAFQFGPLNELLQGVLVGEKVIETATTRVFTESQAAGGIGLRVAINQQRSHLSCRQRRR